LGQHAQGEPFAGKLQKHGHRWTEDGTGKTQGRGSPGTPLDTGGVWGKKKKPKPPETYIERGKGEAQHKKISREGEEKARFQAGRADWGKREEDSTTGRQRYWDGGTIGNVPEAGSRTAWKSIM